MRLSRVVAALAACLPGLAIADPVTVIAIGAQALAAGGVVSAATAAWVGVGVAVYGAAKARTAQRRAAADAKAQQLASVADRNYRPLTNLPPRVTIYGGALTGGYIVDSFATDLTTTGADGITRTYPDGLRHIVIVWAAHSCAALLGLKFGEDSISTTQVDAQGWALPGTPFNRAEIAQRTQTIPTGTSVLPVTAVQILSVISTGDQQPTSYTIAPDMRTITVTTSALVTYTTSKGLPMLRMSHHLGSDSQTVDAYLHSVAPARYTTAHRLAGICYSTLSFDLRFERWQGGPPTPIADILGKRLYDPRTGSTIATFNPALMVLDFLRHQDGFAVDLADIELSTVISAANACEADTFPAGVSGAQMRYQAGGVWETGQSRESILDDLCRAMAGTATYAGTWTISAGVYTPPVMTLTDDDLVGSISIVQAGTPDEQISNGMRGTYIPEGALTASDIEPYSNSTLVAADGGELWDSIDLPYTTANWRARNIARILVETRRNGLVISYPAKRKALWLQPGDRVRVTSPEYGWNEKVFRVTDSQIAPRQPIALTLQEDAPEAWDEVDASAADPTPNTGLPSPWGVVPPITGLAAISGSSVLQIAGDGTVFTRVRVSWDLPAAPYATGVVVTWTPVGGAATTTRVPADQTTLDLIGPIDGQTITISAYVTTITGASVGAYIAHLVLGKSEPPPPVESISVTELPGLGRTILWTYQAPPLDLSGFVARYTSHAAPTAWSAAPELFSAGKDARTYSSTSAPPDGEWDIMIRAVDTTGNLSDITTATVLLTQGSLGTPLMTIAPGALGWPGTRDHCAPDGAWLAGIGSTWLDLPTTWATMPTTWSAITSPIGYTHQIDLGSDSNVRIRADALGNAPITLDIQHSSNGTTWSAWESIPSTHVNAHYLRVRATLTGSATPTIYSMTINLYT